MDQQNDVWVYGANKGGRHGAGSAKKALREYGAKWGEYGFNGRSYGIPTKDENFRVLTIEQIKDHVDDFIVFAEARPDLRFHIVKIGCGLAGFSEDQMAPLFAKAPENCILPTGWLK